MNFLIAFIVCVIMSLLNLPFVLREGGSIPCLLSMIFCAALACFNLAMAVKEK